MQRMDLICLCWSQWVENAPWLISWGRVPDLLGQLLTLRRWSAGKDIFRYHKVAREDQFVRAVF